MTEAVLDGRTLTPATVVRVARRAARPSLHPAARERNRRARDAIEALLERGEPLYGASTGVGALRDRPVPASERAALQRNLLRSHAVDAGPPLPEEVVRAAMVVRANQLGAGGAGVAVELLDGLIDALQAPRAPVVRALGSLGTGDVPGLARIALALLEGGTARERPPVLGLRDALGFVSSNALTVGRACLLWHDVRALMGAGLEVAALSFEAVGADPAPLAACVQEAHGAPGQAAVAAGMREALGIPSDARRDAAVGARVQDAYPFRVVPQVDGVCIEALGRLEALLGRELNARGENALIDAGRPWPSGNFHAAALAAALDALRSALASSARLHAARVSALLDPSLSGLPAFLAGSPGVDSGMMMLEYTAHAAAAEVGSLAAPVPALLAPVSLGVEAHASLAPVSAARLAGQLDALRTLVATELAVAVRAVALSGRALQGPATRRLYEAAAAVLPAGREDRDFGADVEIATAVLERRLAGRWRATPVDPSREQESGASRRIAPACCSDDAPPGSTPGPSPPSRATSTSTRDGSRCSAG